MKDEANYLNTKHCVRKLYPRMENVPKTRSTVIRRSRRLKSTEKGILNTLDAKQNKKHQNVKRNAEAKLLKMSPMIINEAYSVLGENLRTKNFGIKKLKASMKASKRRNTLDGVQRRRSARVKERIHDCNPEKSIQFGQEEKHCENDGIPELIKLVPKCNDSPDRFERGKKKQKLIDTVVASSVPSDEVAHKTNINHLGFDCLLCIFRLLPLPVLLKVSCVCKGWKELTNHHTLWKHVSLDGVHIDDWDKAKIAFNRFQTTTLDFCGLIHNDFHHCMCWTYIWVALKRMSHVVNIHFGEVPWYLLVKISQCMEQLCVLKASQIVATTKSSHQDAVELDIGKLCQLFNLQELRLRAKLSMRLPAFSFCGGLKALVGLTQLRKLSLTSMVGVVNDEWSFLENMSSLEELEVGECSQWTYEVYDMIGNLKQLKSLRLENGGSFCDNDIHFTINLTKLMRLRCLELIRFTIPHELSAALTQLHQLHEVTIWSYCPESSQSMTQKLNENTYRAVMSQANLLKLSWGIVTRVKNHRNIPKSQDKTIPWFTCICQPTVKYCQLCSHVSIVEVTKLLKDKLPTTSLRIFQVPIMKSVDS